MRRPPLFFALLALLGCDSEASIPMRVDETTIRPEAPPLAPFAECVVTTAREPAVSVDHVPPCAPIDYPFHPPASGRHYSQWASFATYDAPVPWGFLVHSLEHGAVVLAYRCQPDDCPAIVDALQSIAGDFDDPVCRGEATPSRFIIVPDPTLDVAIAAVAWEWIYTATCLDLASLRSFVDEHYGRGREELCAPGVDRSATGWCP